MLGGRLFIVKMRGVFPPEKALKMRPLLEATQYLVDQEQEKLEAEVMEALRRNIQFGQPLNLH